MQQAAARQQFLDLLRASISDNSFSKLTLGKCRATDASLENVFVRPVSLKGGPHLSFVHRHATRDITKNHTPAEALALLEKLIGSDFLDAHLFTATQTAQLTCSPDGSARIRIKKSPPPPSPPQPLRPRSPPRTTARVGRPSRSTPAGSARWASPTTAPSRAKACPPSSVR